LFGDIQYEWNIYGGEFQGLRTPWSKDVKWTKLGLGSITLIENISNTNSSRTITMPVFVVSAPNPDITGPQLICINNEAIYTTLKADSTLNSWNTTSNPSYWKLLSDTSIVLMWSKAGDYTLTLKQSIPQTSCEKDVNITIKVMDKIKPVINGNNKVIVNSPYLYTVTGFTNSVEHWYVYGGNITGSPNEDSVLIYWDKPGTGTIYLVQSLGETGCSSSTFMDVQISDVKSVNEGTQNIYVFPNPSSDNLIIVFSNCDFQNAEIMLLDLLGEEVYSQKYESINKDFNLTIDTHQLPVGVYLLKINCENMTKLILYFPILILILLIFAINNSFSQVFYYDSTFDISPGFELPSYIPESRVYAIKLQPDGKILVGGVFQMFNNRSFNGIIRLNFDGSIDTTFNVGEGFDDEVYTITIQNDGKILVGGLLGSYKKNYNYNPYLIRLNPDGSVDSSFRPVIDSYYGINRCEIVQNKIVISYNSDGGSKLMRLNFDGSQDTSFNKSVFYSGLIEVIKALPGNKLLVGGSFWASGNKKCMNIACINYDGSFDTLFLKNTIFEDPVHTIDIDSEGKIILGGDFNGILVDTVWVHTGKFIRFNRDGSIDTTLKVQDGFDGTVLTILLQDDGKILVGGNFSHYNNITQHGICQLNKDGSLNSTDTNSSGFDNGVYCITLQKDRKMIAGGKFKKYDGILSEGLARLTFEKFPQTIQAQIENGDTFFSGDSIKVNITTNMDFNSENIFYLQLSDTNSSFITRTNLNSVNSEKSLSINSKIPENLPTSSLYKLRVISTAPGKLTYLNNNITIITPNIFGPKAACLGFDQYYTDNFPNINYNWNINGGVFSAQYEKWKRYVTWTRIGTDSITLFENIATTNNSRNVTLPVNVIPSLNPVISGPRLVCLNYEAIYTTLKVDSTKNKWNDYIASYSKVPNDTSIILKWDESGDYTLKLTQSIPLTSCNKEVTLQIKVIDNILPIIYGNNKVIENSIELYKTEVFDSCISHWYCYGGDIQ
ncbi:MAG: T9SS type A sorting domain-containing protein, partial [FCB group bacterium]